MLAAVAQAGGGLRHTIVVTAMAIVVTAMAIVVSIMAIVEVACATP